jgi:hypothetical protein
MSFTQILPGEFEKSRINFLPPKPNKLGGQSVLINYQPGEAERNGPFVLQTARMRVPFGVDQSKPVNGEPVKYHVSLSMGDEASQNVPLVAFRDSIRGIDDCAKNVAMTTEKWFGKKLSAELVNEFYKSSEKFPKDKKWDPTIKVKLPFDSRTGKPQFVIYDENKTEIKIVDEDGNVDLSAIPRGSEMVCLIQPTGVWFVGKTQFGVGYKLLQAKVFKTNKLSGYSIVDSDAEEDEVEHTE